MSDPSFAQGLVGVTLDGRYRLDAVLGEGGMGAVFRATQLAMDRKVAVKLLKPHLTSDRVATARFSREARATLKVESPHAVKVLDFGVTPLGDYYMALEYLDGRTVQRELEIDGPFAPARVAHIARQALQALGTAHALGLVHRDIKPDNLLLMRVGDDGDYTKVLDFGVAKLMQSAAGEPALALTAAGMVFGTPEFMSPEQACGQPLDGRSDLYSLAATLFAMLTGTALFEAGTAIEWLTHHARTPPPLLAMVRPELARYPELDALLQRCLAKQRELRPASAEDMARQIAEIEPTLARPGSALPRTASKPTQIQASGFVEVLREPVPATAAVPAAVPAPPRRGLYLGLGGVAIAAIVGLAIGLSVVRSRSGSTSITGQPSAGPALAASGPAGPQRAAPSGPAPPAATANAATPTPAASASTPPAAAAPATPRAAQPPSAALAPVTPAAGPAAGSRPAAARGAPAARNPAAEEHLRAAEDAYRSHNPLRQLAEADLALRVDPRSVRARYLLGDALIKSGDLDHGCRYLDAIKHVAAARDRARAAGCAGD